MTEQKISDAASELANQIMRGRYHQDGGGYEKDQLLSAIQTALDAYAEEAVRKASQWRSMESAPADEQSILAANEKSGLMFVCWRDDLYKDEWRLPHSNDKWKPTHWMLLPAPPTEKLP